MPLISLEEALGLIPPQTPETKNPARPASKTKQPNQKPPTPAKLRKQTLKEAIITDFLAKLKIKTICTKHNITKPTFYTYIAEWAQNDQGLWLQIEWVQIYLDMKENNPAEAFRGLTRIICILKRRQDQIEVNIQNNINIQTELTNRINQLIEISEQACKASNPNLDTYLPQQTP